MDSNPKALTTPEPPGACNVPYAEQIARLVKERDAAEDRFVKARKEVVEQEQEISDLHQELGVRKAMYARLQEEYDAAKPYIIVPADSKPGQVIPVHRGISFAWLLMAVALFWIVTIGGIIRWWIRSP